jgi:hypothetical protein
LPPQAMRSDAYPSNTKIQVDFSDQFIDNWLKHGISGG